MEIKQKTYLECVKGNKLVQVVVDQDMPLGLLFDALMELKGFAIEKMQVAHKQEQEVARQQMGDAPEELEQKED